MGMHIGLIAARTSATRFREAFSRTWRRFEVVESVEHLADADEIENWRESHEQFVSAANWSRDNPGREVYAFWQDGPWAVMMDGSYTLATDEAALRSLSNEFGTAVSFVVETAGGCADFWCFEQGDLRRRISNADGKVTTAGDPLPQEAGIDTAHYYMDETEALWKAFGLSPIYDNPTSHECQAVCVIDRTDYGGIADDPSRQPSSGVQTAREVPSVKRPSPKRSWWKLW